MSDQPNARLKYCCEKLQPFWLWHLDFFPDTENPDQSISHDDGNLITIVLLDTNFANRKLLRDNFTVDFTKTEQLAKKTTKIKIGKRFPLVDENINNHKNLLSQLMKKRGFVEKLLQKNHSFISAQLIHQIAPHAKIIIIPTLSQQGFCSKAELLAGLKKAETFHPDIVHLGLQCRVITDDKQNSTDYELLQQFQKFRFVVTAAGNDGKKKAVGYPARCCNCISVGAFAKHENHFPICDFSQATKEHKVDFVMPGRCLTSIVWVEEIEDFIVTATHGTSMAAALMSGVLAKVLQHSAGNFSTQKIMHLLYKYSVKLEHSWHDCVNYGIPLVNDLLKEIAQAGATKELAVTA